MAWGGNSSSGGWSGGSGSKGWSGSSSSKGWGGKGGKKVNLDKLLNVKVAKTDMEKLQTQIGNLDTRLKSVGVDGQVGDDRNAVEKFLNLPTHTGFLGDVLKILDRPRNAVATAVHDASTKGDPLGGLAKGFLGRDTHTFDELLPNSFRKDHPYLSAGIGFAGDVLTDPTTYIGVGALKSVAKPVAGAVAKVATGSEKLLAHNASIAADTSKLGQVESEIGAKAAEMRRQEKINPMDAYARETHAGPNGQSMTKNRFLKDNTGRSLTDWMKAGPDEIKAAITGKFDNVIPESGVMAKQIKFPVSVNAAGKQELQKLLGVIGHAGTSKSFKKATAGALKQVVKQEAVPADLGKLKGISKSGSIRAENAKNVQEINQEISALSKERGGLVDSVYQDMKQANAGNMVNQFAKMGVRKPQKGDAFYEEFKMLPKGVQNLFVSGKNRTAMAFDEAANALNMSARDLLDTLSGGRKLITKADASGDGMVKHYDDALNHLGDYRNALVRDGADTLASAKPPLNRDFGMRGWSKPVYEPHPQTASVGDEIAHVDQQINELMGEWSKTPKGSPAEQQILDTAQTLRQYREQLLQQAEVLRRNPVQVGEVKQGKSFGVKPTMKTVVETRGATNGDLQRLAQQFADKSGVDKVWNKNDVRSLKDIAEKDQSLQGLRDMRGQLSTQIAEKTADDPRNILQRAGGAVADALGKTFNRNHIPIGTMPEQAAKMGQYFDRRQEYENMLSFMRTKSIDEALQVAKKYNLTDEEMTMITKGIESPQFLKGSDPEIIAKQLGKDATDPIVALVARAMDNPQQARVEMAASVLPVDVVKQAADGVNKMLDWRQRLAGAKRELQDLTEARRRTMVDAGFNVDGMDNYIHHALTPAGEVRSQKMAKTAGRSTAPLKAMGPKERTIDGTVEEINKDRGMKFFEDNAVKATAMGNFKSAGAVETKKFVDDTIKEWGMEIPAGGRIPHGYKEFDPSALKFFPVTNASGEVSHMAVGKAQTKVLLPEHIADDLNHFAKGVETQDIVKLWDKSMNVWKTLVTTTPSFHLRNFMGNFFNSYLAMGRDTVRYPEYLTLAIKAMRGKSINFSASGVNYDAKRLMREFEMQGLGGKGQFGDITTHLGDAIDMARLKGVEKVKHIAKNPLKNTPQFSRQIGSNVEDASKLALFSYRLSKGDTPKQAAGVVRKYLYDYNQLTHTEQKVLKRFMPFYTFTRKNLPLQMERLLLDPGKYAAVSHLQDNMTQAVGVDDQNLAGYLRDQLAMPFAKDNGGITQYFAPNLPLSDLSKIGNPLDLAISSTTPFLKVPIEMYLNKNTFTKQPIEKYAGETKNYFGVDVNKNGLGYLLDQFAPLRNLNDTVNPAPGKTAKVPIKGSLIKEHNPDQAQKSAQYTELKKLQDMVKTHEAKTGQKVPTVQELQKIKKLQELKVK